MMSMNQQIDNNVEKIQKILQYWGEGKLNGDDQMANIAEFFTEDCVFDSSADTYIPMRMFRKFNGHVEIAELFTLLAEDFIFEDVNPIVFPGPNDAVYVRFAYSSTYKATGKKYENGVTMEEFFFENGRVKSGKFYYDDPAKLAALARPHDNVAQVQKCFQYWGEGKFNGEDKMSHIAELFTEDCVFDCSVAVPMRLFRKFSGHVEVAESFALLAEDFDFESVNPVIFSGSNDAVYVKFSYSCTYKATGKKHENAVTMEEFTVDNGRIKTVRLYFDDPAKIDSLAH